MPVTAKFHTSPTRQHGGTRFPAAQKQGYMTTYVPPKPDPVAAMQASKANELLNLRSKNINHILAQRSAFGAHSHMPIELPAANPRIDELHKELKIDEVVLVKSPFVIDTTPGGMWQPQHQSKPEPPAGARARSSQS